MGNVPLPWPWCYEQGMYHYVLDAHCWQINLTRSFQLKNKKEDKGCWTLGLMLIGLDTTCKSYHMFCEVVLHNVSIMQQDSHWANPIKWTTESITRIRVGLGSKEETVNCYCNTVILSWESGNVTDLLKSALAGQKQGTDKRHMLKS